MHIKEVRRLSSEGKLLYWVRERHNIFLKRQRGEPKPWTDDVILQSYFFTNPFRENDKTTVWLRENVRDPLRNSPDVLMATVIFRWFNLPATGAVLLGGKNLKGWDKTWSRKNLLVDWDEDMAVTRLKAQWQDGANPVFGAGYIIKAGNGPRGCKIPNVCKAISGVWEKRKELVALCRSDCRMQTLHKVLQGFYGLGPFNSYEVVCDLRYTALLENASDKLTWANMGPGAKRGLNRVLDRPLTTPISKALWLREVDRLRKKMERLQLSDAPTIEAREVEHSLCEADKYIRALEGTGHMKRRYNGGA